PRLLPFTQQPRARRPFLSHVRRYGALAAAACLLLALGVALGGRPLQSSDAVAGRDWDDVRAERHREKDQALITARDGHAAMPPRAFSLTSGNPPVVKPDAPPPPQWVAQQTTKLKKARQERSAESIDEVAVGVETYLASSSPYFYSPSPNRAKFLPARLEA